MSTAKIESIRKQITNLIKLKQDFNEDAQRNIAKMYQCGYKPTEMERWIENSNGDAVKAIKKVCANNWSRTPRGFSILRDMNMAHLSIQALVITPKYKELFDNEERAYCMKLMMSTLEQDEQIA